VQYFKEIEEAAEKIEGDHHRLGKKFEGSKL
jgi:hypothetical protein